MYPADAPNDDAGSIHYKCVTQKRHWLQNKRHIYHISKYSCTDDPLAPSEVVGDSSVKISLR